MTAWRIVLPYIVLGSLWILGSDWWLARSSPGGFVPGQTVKGILFVLVSAGLIYALAARELRERRQAAEQRLRLERRLAATERFEAIGQLTSGIAHDFNNLLTAIYGNIETCLHQVPPGETPPPGLEDARSSALRGAELTRQLLAVGRSQVMRPEQVDINNVILGMCGLLDRLIGPPVRIRAELADEPWLVLVDPGRLEQVIMNLAINARDAMPGGGELTVRTANRTVTPAEARGFPFPFLPGDYVVLEVADTGVGMEPDVQGRIFEPFFTTKPKDVGTGLGLATVYGIVKQSGGYVAVSSTPGQGSTFSIYLPEARDAEEATPILVPDPPAGGETGTETLLVVEDDPAVRAFAIRALRRRGFTVLEAVGADEALQLLRESNGHVDLLITDATMPGMSGEQLISQLRSSGSRVRTLLISGRGEHELAVDAPYLAKPFTGTDLGRRVREVLDHA
jgi:two-component system, cell cycle sensor histidine kinase and response regulator CckA